MTDPASNVLTGPWPANDHQQRSTALVRGVERRLTNLDELNARFALLEAPDTASAYISRSDSQPITDVDLKRRLLCEAVHAGDEDGKPVYVGAFPYWTGHARHHIFRRIAFANQADLPDDTFNLFRGFGVTPRAGECKRIIEHILEVICSGNEADGNAMLNLLAWQMQNIGEPSRVITSLKSEKHQVGGKGLIFDKLMLKIYGPSGVPVSKADQVLGKFNTPIRGCAYMLFDEVMFAGDRRAADDLKRLSTASTYGIEGKGLPTITCPVAVNSFLLSNHANAAFIEENDARYWALDVSDRRAGDTRYFAALVHEIKHGGAEAFAHHLLNLDVRDFLPSRDVPKDNDAKREMIRQSWNAYDARKWLEDCCHLERILGRKVDASGADWPWVAGAEHDFGALRNAYVAWQKDVKGRDPKPTDPRELGKVLSKHGFGSRPSNGSSLRRLPEVDVCLALLRKQQG